MTGLLLGALDLFGEYPTDAVGVGQSSGDPAGQRGKGPSPWLVSTQHGGGQRLQPSTSCITPPFPPTQGPKGTSGKPGKPGEAGLPGLPGVDVSVPSYCIPTSSHPCLSQPSSGSDFHCCSAAGLIQAGNLVLTEVTVVPSGGPWPSSQTLPAPGWDRRPINSY